MTLPTTLMPSGALTAMRDVAQQFMTTPITIYDVTETYSIYGEAVRVSGVVWSGLGYVGKLSARDVDLVTSSDFYRTRDEGVEIKYMATILMPFEVVIEDDYKISANNVIWEIIWNNNATSDPFQLYTKALVRDTRYVYKRTLGV